MMETMKQGDFHQSWPLILLETGNLRISLSFLCSRGCQRAQTSHPGHRKVRSTRHQVSQRVGVSLVNVGYGKLIVTT